MPKNGHYKAYILGYSNDVIAKTQNGRLKITGIPAEKLLISEIGSTKPAFISSQGWGLNVV